MDGVLVIDKPAGMTSHDVVDAVRSRLGVKRVGHGGTLDPQATGVLIVGVGRATRFLAYSQAAPKRYVARARFGVTTTTQDAWGEVIDEVPVELTADDLARVLPEFVGELDQVPPMMSAVKVGGERLYRKAMRNEEIERVPRRVIVYDLRLEGFEDSGDLVEAVLGVRCSAGTYVRTLVHDIGSRLGCGAHVVSLRRTEAGGFTARDCIRLDDVASGALRPLADAVRQLPRREVTADEETLVSHGRPLGDGGGIEEAQPVALVRGGRLVAVYRRMGDRLVADRVVPA